MKHGLIAVALLAPSLAGAQERGEESETIVVTASRSNEGVPLDSLGGSATVLSPEALEQRQTRIVSDILRDVPGVAVSRLGGVGGQTQIRLRGSEGNHVLVLIDGIEVSDPFQGEFDFGTLIADDAARIEVLRGQQSALYGSDAIGGVILYQTLSGREAPGVRLRAEGGSFGTLAASARAAGAEGAFDYAANATFFTTDGTPTARGGERDVGAENAAASIKLGWQASEAFRLSAVARYQLSDADFNDTDFDPASPGFGLIVDSPGVRSESEAVYALLRADIGSGRWTGALTAQVADTRRDTFDGADRTSGNTGTRYKGSAETTLRFGDAHRLTLALDAEREEFRNTSPGDFAFTGKRSGENLGLVAQYEYRGEALGVSASIRHDENDRFADPTTWRAAASYRFASGTKVRAAGGSGVKNPLFYELFGFSDGRYIGNPNLKPERSEGFEIGIDQDFAGGSVGLTYFDNRLEDEIFIRFLPDFTAVPDNRDTRSRQRGIEAFASLRPAPRFTLDAAYTYLRAREDGEVEVRRPKHIASVNATYASGDRFLATLTARYTGRQRDLAFTDPSFVPVVVTLDDFVLVNLAGQFALTERVGLFARVENLLDADYEQVFGYTNPGRAAYLGARASF